MLNLGTYIFYTILMIIMISLSLKPSYASESNTFVYNKYWNINSLTVIILYSFLIGCRYYVGIDYKSYLEWYLELNETGIFPRDIELGYKLLNELLNYVNAHYVFLFIIISFLQIFFLYKSLEQFSFVIPWFIFFFFTYLLMFSSMNIMRQTLAWFICFYSLSLFIRKKYILSSVCILLGFSFHKSILVGAIFFPFLWFDWLKNRYIQFLLLLIVTIMASKILDIILSVSSPIISLIGYKYYLENLDYMYEITEENKVGAGTSRALFFILDIVIIFYSTELKERFLNYKFFKYYNLYFLGIIIDRIVYDNFILARTNDYLLNFRVLILSFLLYYLFNSESRRFSKKILGYIIAIIMVAYFYRAIYNSAAETSPYRFIFFEDVLQSRPQKLPDY